MPSSSKEKEKLLAEYNLLQQEKAQRKKRKAFLYYQPHPKQKLFHLSNAFIRLLVTGNRFGKTESSFVELCWHLTGEYPEWYPQSLRYKHSITARWACPDFEKGVGEILQEKIDKYLPWDYVTGTDKNSRGFIIKYYFKNGSKLDVATYEQELLTFEGVSRDIIHFDEPPPRDKFVASLRALVDRGGRISLSLTPISEPWIFDELYMQEGEEDKFRDLDVECISGTIYDNPHLTMEYIKKFEAMLSPEEKEARIYGRFLKLMGLVYKQLSRAVHGKERFNIPPDWPRWMVVDPHDRRPHYCGWFAVDETDDVYFYRFAKVEGTIYDVGKYIRDTEEGAGENIIRRLIDPNFGQKIYGNSKMTVRQEFQLAGEQLEYDLRFQLANDNIEAGHLRVKDYLRYNPNLPISLTNKPKFFMFTDMREPWHDMQRYVYDEWKSNAMEKTPQEKPKNLFKDVPDLVRYCLMDSPCYVSPEVCRPSEVSYV